MIDYHIHIGQFNEIYYDPLELFNIIESVVEKTSVTELHYSTTTSCRYDVELPKIEEEIAYAQQFDSNFLTVKPYLWVVPKYAEQGISVKSALKNFNYCGVKLHPFAQKWDFDNEIHRKCIKEIFEFASEKDFYSFNILIHCGKEAECRPKRFEQYFRDFPQANVILAHSYPVHETIEMLQTYKNVRSDIAYATEYTIQKLVHSSINKKVLFGTDFPLTHYFGSHLLNKNNTLAEEYIENCSIKLNKYEKR